MITKYPSSVKAASKQSKQVVSTENSSVVDVPLNDLKSFVGKGDIGTEGRVYGYKKFANFTLVNVGAAYPNQQLSLLLKGKARNVAASIDGKTIVIIGKVTFYKGKHQIEVVDSSDIVLN